MKYETAWPTTRQAHPAPIFRCSTAHRYFFDLEVGRSLYHLLHSGVRRRVIVYKPRYVPIEE